MQVLPGIYLFIVVVIIINSIIILVTFFFFLGGGGGCGFRSAASLKARSVYVTGWGEEDEA